MNHSNIFYLAELMGINETWYRNRDSLQIGMDCNNAKSQGTYYVFEGALNGPGFNYFIMTVYTAGGAIIQVAYHEFSNSTKRRSMSSSGAWTEWS